ISADLARGHGGGDRPPSRQIGTGCRGKNFWIIVREAETPQERQESRQTRDPRGNQEPRQHFDLTPHIQSKLWPRIQKGIDQHLAKVYIDNNSSLRKEHWVLKLDGTRGNDPAEGSRHQYADGCALHQGPDNDHGSKRQAAGAHFRCWMIVMSDDRMSQLLTQLESQHEVGGGSGSGGGGDDEPGADEDANGNEDADGDEEC
ncbi:hypothetical protein Tco_0574960, partial [Tanacetum coccineum]